MAAPGSLDAGTATPTRARGGPAALTQALGRFGRFPLTVGRADPTPSHASRRRQEGHRGDSSPPSLTPLLAHPQPEFSLRLQGEWREGGRGGTAMGALRPAPARPPHSLTALVAPTPHQTPQRQPPDFCQQHPFLWACSPYPTPSEHERQEAFHAATCRGRAGCTPTPRAPLSGHGLSGRLRRGRQPRWCPLPLGLEGELHPPCTPAPLSHCPGPCEASPALGGMPVSPRAQ